MDKIEKIRKEIERLKKYAEGSKREWEEEGYNQNAFAEDCRITSFDGLLSFIDTLSEEPDKDLEDAAKEYCKTIFHKPFSENPQEEHIVYEPDKYDGFIAGAKWKEKQMLKEAVEGDVIYSGFDDGMAFVLMNIPDRRYDRGDKVKLIIIKDDGKSD